MIDYNREGGTYLVKTNLKLVQFNNLLDRILDRRTKTRILQIENKVVHRHLKNQFEINE